MPCPDLRGEGNETARVHHCAPVDRAIQIACDLFVGLSVLTPVVFGTAYYYPYAYVDAPAPHCDGLTEDGCELEWQSVPTLEGQAEFACVAYCPWNE
jgi:hypothetical protein